MPYNAMYIKNAIMEFIKTYVEKHNYPPSEEEIARELGISPRQTKKCLRSLILDERLQTDAKLGTDRAIRVPEYKLVKITGDAETKKYVMALLNVISNITDSWTAKIVYIFAKNLKK